MAKTEIRIKSGIPTPRLVVDTQSVGRQKEAGIAVNLRYFKKSCECFSAWQTDELKAFANLIEKLLGYSSEDQLKSNTTICHAHMGKPNRARFSRPNISDEIPLYGLDAGRKARVHGFFQNSTFYLVWLDRKHECF